MSEKSLKFETNFKTLNEEMIDNNQNDDQIIESNNKIIKSNLKTVNHNIEDINGHKNVMDISDQTNGDTNSVNACKVCNNEDLSTQFFASGPFYAIDSAVEQMAQNMDNRSDSSDRRERSDKCNVLYAEMPHIFGDDIHLVHNHNSDQKTQMSDANGIHCNNGSPHLNNLDTNLSQNYQLFCYNCCSPLNIGEESHLNHNLYYISNEESKIQTKCQTIEAEDEHRSCLSSPIMLKFCRESVEQLNQNLVTNESNSCNSNEIQSNYTTVIKPKAVRPSFASNVCEISGQSSSNEFGSHLIGSTLPTLSFHGSATVLTDSDESAFTQIPRRRSNSEATHHYQSISVETNRIPSRSYIENSRPLQGHQRSKSVNKTYNNWNNSLGFSKCQAISDKHLTKNNSNNSNNNNNYFNRKTNFDENLTKQKTTEPIHMTLEDVKNIFTKNQSKRIKNSFFVQKHKRFSNEFEERNSFNKSRSKSKIKCAIESLFRNKRKSGSPIPTNDRNSIDSEPIDKTSIKDLNESVCVNHCSSDSTSPFTHRALPPLPNNEMKTIINRNESLSKEEEDERQKFLDYAASIERVKDCGWYWGPISGEMAEKLLASEPCGSFIVRDSSDEHYIFSLTFKLNGMVRHVRIEHDQGNFSFGSLQKFRSNTIVDFIENAVQHSRSGRFLFFLHRRPVMGPMRVQLLHPVSRFKQIQSLQHMCRFIILKHVRRDLIESLPLPQMLKQYLNTPYYYSEELALMSRDDPNPQQLDQSLPPNTSQPII